MTERRLPNYWAVLRTTKDNEPLFDRLLTSYNSRHDGTTSWRVSERVKSIVCEGSWYHVTTYDGEEFVCRPDAEGVAQVMLENLSYITKETTAIYGGNTELIVMSPEKFYGEEDSDE